MELREKDCELFVEKDQMVLRKAMLGQKCFKRWHLQEVLVEAAKGDT